MALCYVAHQLWDTVDTGLCMDVIQPVATEPGHDTVPVMWI